MRGGARAGAGRPPGSTSPRHTPTETLALLAPLRHPHESWAALARRAGINPKVLSRALVEGGTVAFVERVMSALGHTMTVKEGT